MRIDQRRTPVTDSQPKAVPGAPLPAALRPDIAQVVRHYDALEPVIVPVLSPSIHSCSCSW